MDTIKNLVNEISIEDQNKIEEYIKAYALDENDYFPNSHHFAGIEKILQPWSASKQNLFKLLGNNLMISKRVSFDKPEEEMRQSFYTVLDDRDSSLSKFLSNFEDLFLYTHGKYRKFLEENLKTNLQEVFAALTTIISVDALITNKVPEHFAKTWNSSKTLSKVSFPTPTGKTIDISVGAKVMKILGKIANEFDIPGFEEFRIEHSRIMNDRKMSGNITISIHPLDFMTMSDNGCNWESCMSWKNFGCYRQGTVEMMNSPYVVVGYMNSDKPMYLFDDECEEYTWTNKRLRCLFIVSNEFIAKVKSYPYQHEAFEKTIIDWLADLSKENLGIDYEPEFFELTSRNIGKNIVYKEKELKISFSTNNMYNDFGSGITSYIRFNDHILDIDLGRLCFCYSGPSECMWCGETNFYCSNTDVLTCDVCSSRNYCSECGTRIYDDNYYTTEDEGCYCEYCFDNYCVKNLLTGEYNHKENLTKIYIVKSAEDIKKANKDIESYSNMSNMTIRSLLVSSRCRSFYISYIEDFDDIDEKTKNDLNKLFNIEKLEKIEYKEWGCNNYIFVISFDDCSDQIKEYYNEFSPSSYIHGIDEWAKVFTCLLEDKKRELSRQETRPLYAFTDDIYIETPRQRINF